MKLDGIPQTPNEQRELFDPIEILTFIDINVYAASDIHGNYDMNTSFKSINRFAITTRCSHFPFI